MSAQQPNELTTAFIVTLQRYQQLLDSDIQHKIDVMLADAATYGSYSKQAMQAYTDILGRGGKRLRGALVMTAYYMLGGQDHKMILQAARAIEMIHAYLLIIDDFSDRSHMRRGGPTAHIAMRDYHKQHNLHGDSDHFGMSMAMHAAIAGWHWAQTDITELAVDDTTKLMALHNLNNNISITIHGQFNDMFNEVTQTADEQQVIRMLTWKTAYYSFLSPLQFGAILARAEPSDLEYLREYAMPMGLAFQIIDDILGTFGNEFESGKSATDDLKEGKITLLVARAFAKANAQQKQQLLQALGNQSLTPEQYEAAKQVIEDTGTLDYCRRLAQKYAAQAVIALQNVPSNWQNEQTAFLRDLTTYITMRTK